jgi:hypothetical protein
MQTQSDGFAAVARATILWGDGRQGFGIQVVALENFLHPLTAGEHRLTRLGSVFTVEAAQSILAGNQVLWSEALVVRDLVTPGLNRSDQGKATWNSQLSIVVTSPIEMVLITRRRRSV